MFPSSNEPCSMTRHAVVTVLALLLALGSSLPSSAQTSGTPPGTTDEAGRREEAYQLIGGKLAQADRDAAAGRLADASRRYEEAYTLAVRVGAKADPEKAKAVAGVSSTRLQLAQSAQKRGYLNEAVAHAERVLRVDPLNQEAGKL